MDDQRLQRVQRLQRRSVGVSGAGHIDPRRRCVIARDRRQRAHRVPGGGRHRTAHRQAQPLAVGIGLPVEREVALYPQAAADALDAQCAQALDHQQCILIDERGIALALHRQVAGEHAIVHRAAGRERRDKTIFSSETTQQRERGWNLRHRRRMHRDVGGLRQQHGAVRRLDIHPLPAAEDRARQRIQVARFASVRERRAEHAQQCQQKACVAASQGLNSPPDRTGSGAGC